MAIVYLATNEINGKRYVGVTNGTLHKRKLDHFAKAKDSTTKFGRALRKYGKKNFTWEIIKEFSEYDKALLAEIQYIAKLKPEYNITAGGQGMLGYKPSAKTRAILRKNGKKSLPLFKKYAHLGPKASSKKVVCLTTGKKFDSASSAARFYKVCKSQIIELCNGSNRRLTVGGLIFNYDGKKSKVSKRKKLKVGNFPRPVICLTDNKVYPTIAEAARKYKISKWNLSDLCHGQRYNKLSGRKFAFADGGK